MSENKTVAKQRKGGVGLWTQITAVLLVINVAIVLVGTYAIYPTQTHRDVAHRLSEMSQQFVTESGAPVYDTDEYKNLESTPEARYIATASIVAGVIDFALTVVLVGLVYNYLRKNRLSRSHKEVGITVFTNTVAVVLAWLLTIPLVAAIANTAPPSPAMLLFEFAAITVVSLIVLFVIAYIFDKLYTRKHSLVVE